MSGKYLGLVVAAGLGAALALFADRVLRPTPSPSIAATRPLPAEPPPPPPAPVDPGPARALVVSTLVEAGVSHGAIEHGLYPLRGPGRKADETLPLVSFTCPADKGCAPLFAAIEAAAGPVGLMLVGHAGPDRNGRPWFRALADSKGRPALAMRAFPPGPRLTLIVGDAGREPALLDALLALDEDVTYAVLANAPHAPQVAARLAETGREVLAHLPMEPAAPATADGADFLTTAATPEATAAATAALLDRVPRAVGADNHLGGQLTTSRPHMGAVLQTLGERGLFFVDGRASDASVAAPAARALGVRTAVRTHALDGAPGGIDARLRAIEVALVLDGAAVVTATPSPEVLAALRPWLTGLRARGIHLLRGSEIVR